MNLRLALTLGAAVAVACDDKRPPTAESTPPPASVTALAVAPSVAPSAASPAAPASAAAAKTAPDAIAAQHVLVAFKGAKDAPKTVTRSKADAKKRAEEVATKAKGGADFTAIVAEYTDDLGTKERAGSLGKFTREKMIKPFSDAAFALAVDETSAPVETPYGFHVIKRNQ